MPSKGDHMEPIHKQPVARTVAEAIIEQLSIWGIKRIYGVIGDAIFGLMDAIAKQNKISFVNVKHESVAAMMASAEAKITGNIGVCIAQMGPGLANLINGLGDAYLDKVPILAITGQAPLKKLGTPYKQYINQQELVQAITGYSELVVHPDAVVKALTKAIHTSVSEETVAHLSIPMDIFKQQTLMEISGKTYIKTTIFCKEQCNKAVRMMKKAKTPMILMGNTVRSEKEAIQKLAEHWGSGIVTEYGAIGIFEKAYPYYLGSIGEGGNPALTALFKQADMIVAIGTSWWPDGHTPKRATIIQIQEGQGKFGEWMPIDHSIIGSITEIIAKLTMELQSFTINEEWVKQVYECQKTSTMQNEDWQVSSNYPLHPISIVKTIEKCTTQNTIIALDEGDSTLWFMANFKGQCEDILLSRNWRTMGFGLPAALTAKLIMTDKHVICITGDGGLAMVLADLLTAARYGLNITLIIFNNGTLQMERNKMTLKGLIPEGTEITNPNFTTLAKSCGWEAHSISNEEELEMLLQTAQSKQTPVLLDVPTAQETYLNYPNE